MPTYYFTSDVDEGMHGVGFNTTQLVWLSMGGRAGCCASRKIIV